MAVDAAGGLPGGATIVAAVGNAGGISPPQGASGRPGQCDEAWYAADRLPGAPAVGRGDGAFSTGGDQAVDAGGVDSEAGQLERGSGLPGDVVGRGEEPPGSGVPAVGGSLGGGKGVEVDLAGERAAGPRVACIGRLDEPQPGGLAFSEPGGIGVAAAEEAVRPDHGEAHGVLLGLAHPADGPVVRDLEDAGVGGDLEPAVRRVDAEPVDVRD